MKYPEIKNFLNGNYVLGTGQAMDVINPSNGEVLTKIILSKKEDLQKEISSISIAQKKWAKLTFKKRCEVLRKYQQLLTTSTDELAMINHLENGKTIEDAIAGIEKGIEVLENAIALENYAVNSMMEVSTNVYCFTQYRSLGIVASITPFNFPVMVPHWTITHAIACGNAMILKPSELTPMCADYITKLWKKAGLPDGIFNVIYGSQEIVEEICENPEIKAVTFVGSSRVAEIVYQKASANNKRCIALGEAKNHLVLMPDANNVGSINDIINSAYGMNGQRCMATSVLIIVGEFMIKDELIKKIKEIKLKDNVNLPEGIGAVISKQNKTKILDYIKYAIDNGGQILVDGREFDPPNQTGNYIGPTLINWTNCPEKMKTIEIFGPVLEIIQVKTLQEAIEIQKKSPYGNAASIFTKDGQTAFQAIKEFEAGMLGINIGIPVPREPFSFGGIKLSKYGYGDITDQQALNFWTDLIKVTMKWNLADRKDWIS